MFTLEELFSKRNQRMAFEHMKTKKEGRGSDGMYLSELESYWEVNGNHIIQEIKNKAYEPGIILIYEIAKQKGKSREIANLTVLDRFLTRLLSQKLNRYIETTFLENSYAYQEGKGIVAAIDKVKEYVEQGNSYIIEVDLKDYFNTIPLERLLEKIKSIIKDERVLQLIIQYLYCKISVNGKIYQKQEGLIQGSAISPVLSNLYLHECDCYLEKQNTSWIRFADNYYVLTNSFEDAVPIYESLCEYLENIGLIVNKEKSGIYEVNKRRVLGYDIFYSKGKLDIRKHVYQEVQYYEQWYDSSLEVINGQYHILSDGIINKKDYSLLFENEQKRCYIPVEVTDQINIYGNVFLAPNVLQMLNQKQIKASFFDKYGHLIGMFIPENGRLSSDTILLQAKNYIDETKRIDMAKRMQIASIHNIRANLRYYNKRMPGELKGTIQEISDYITEINQCKSVSDMMLIEAKVRQKYYAAFNYILQNKEFSFEKRTKRPPKDPLNACISFGNTLLYNYFSNVIWKKGLHPRFGVVHATTRRCQSLNLDFADIFKPVIIDKIIFTAINKKMLHIEKDFIKNQEGGVYLSNEGKKIFLSLYEEKLNSKMVIKGQEKSYRQLMNEEVQKYKNELLEKDIYKPYKYY